MNRALMAAPLLLLAACVASTPGDGGAGGSAPPCTPIDACPTGKCGVLPDGCGRTLDCASNCGDPLQAFCAIPDGAADGICLPILCPDCASFDAECGRLERPECPTLECGTCPLHSWCRPSEEGSTLGRCDFESLACSMQAVDCGHVYETEPDLDCGGCLGDRCNAHACRCGERRMTGLDVDLDPEATVHSWELDTFLRDGEVWAIFATSAHNGNGGTNDEFESLVTGRLSNPYEIEPRSLSHLPGTLGPRGYVSHPQVRPDARELAFHASWPDANWMDNELYVAVFDGTAWLPPALLRGLDEAEPDFALSAPIWLDDRTLLVARDPPSTPLPRPALVQRPTAEPGDVRFALLETDVWDDPKEDGYAYSLTSFTVSCDRTRLIYVRESSASVQLRRRTFTWDGTHLTVGPPEPYPSWAAESRAVPAPGAPDIWQTQSLEEHADCAVKVRYTTAFVTGEIFALDDSVTCP